MGICYDVKNNKENNVFYDLSSLVTTLEVAKIRNVEQGNNLVQQMAKILQDLAIVENSNFYNDRNINSFYNMLLDSKKPD